MEKLGSQLLSETKDVNVFCLYTQTITAKYGLEGFKVGCEIIAENLEKYWEVVYPKLVDEDGEPDAYYRINALSLLMSESGIIKQVNNALFAYQWLIQYPYHRTPSTRHSSR